MLAGGDRGSVGAGFTESGASLTYSDEIRTKELLLGEEHFVFVKPELLDYQHGAIVKDTLEIVLSKLSEVGIVDLMVLISSPSVQAERILHAQYKVLHALSSEPPDWLRKKTRDAIRNQLSLKCAAQEILTASEAVERFWHGDIEALRKEWDSQASVKVGPGFYVSQFQHSSETFAVVNGFYPSQHAWLTRTGGHLLCLRLNTSLPMHHLREQVIGAVRPEEAKRGSIRQAIFERKESLGLSEVSLSKNGVHISPNPFDAMLGITHLHSLHGADITKCSFYQHALRESPDLAHYLEDYVYREQLTELQYDIHSQCEDLSYKDCIDMLKDWHNEKSALNY